MAASSYQIAAGHNNPGGLVAINTIVDANSVTLAPPRGVATEGARADDVTGGTRLRGYPSITLYMPMLKAQRKKINDTYLGPVTLRASLDGGDTFANYNAVSKRIEDFATLDGQRIDLGLLLSEDVSAGFTGIGYSNVGWVFVRLEAI